MRRLLLTLVIAGAYCFTIFSLTSCRFWESNTEGGSVAAAGLYSFSYRHEICISFRSVMKTDWGVLIQLNSNSKFAQAMGALAGILGGMACLLTLFGSCLLSFCTMSKKIWRTMLATSIWGALIAQSLTFCILIQVNSDERCADDDVECYLGFGGLCSIFACCLYFLAGVVLSALALQPPKENPGTTYLARLGTRLMTKLGLSWKDQAFYKIIRWQDVAILILVLLLLNSSCTILLDCRFYKITFQNDTKTYYEGLLRYYYPLEDTCRNFERGSLTSFTGQTWAANVFALITVLLACILAGLLLCMILIFNFPSAAYQSLPFLSLMASICQPFVFLGNRERNDILCEGIPDQDCHIGPDGYMAIANTIIYFFFVPALRWYGNNPNQSLPPPATSMEEADEDNDPALMVEKQEAPLAPPECNTATAATNDGKLPPPEIDTEMGGGAGGGTGGGGNTNDENNNNNNNNNDNDNNNLGTMTTTEQENNNNNNKKMD